MATNITHVKRLIKAPRADIYRALLDAEAIAQWKFPDGMAITIHQFEGRQGGAFRVSLTYTDKRDAGKTTEHTDTYHGRFVQLVPNEKVVEEEAFETSDSSMQGNMTATFMLSDVEGGTLVEATHEGLPPGVSAQDNELGWNMALSKLATFVEKPPSC
jgi:uncharacterized protein YndB with AHSA1/START domain